MSKLKIFKYPLAIVGLLYVFALVVFGVGKISTTIIVSPKFEANVSQSVSVIKSYTLTQLPAVSGQPVKWVKTIKAESLLKGEHLLELPKLASKIKITPVNKIENKKIENNKIVSNTDRNKLVAEAKQRATSKESLALAKSLKTELSTKFTVGAKELASKDSGILSSFFSLFSKFNNIFMSASVAEAVPTVLEPSAEPPVAISVEPAPEPTPVPEVIVVDVIAPAPMEVSAENISITNPSEVVTPVETAIQPEPSNPTPQTETTPAVSSTMDETASSSPTTPPQETSAPLLGQEGRNTESPVSSPVISADATTTLPSMELSLPTFASTTSTDADTATSSDSILRDSADMASSTPISRLNLDIPILATTTPDVLVSYETPAPVIAEATTDTGKIVQVSAPSESSPSSSSLDPNPYTLNPDSYTNVLAFTTIPEIYKVGQENKIKIKWTNNGDQAMEFHAYDTNNNGKLDYVEWTVPHLSTQTFEIIFISKAFELDENKDIAADIYDQVQAQDNVWATVGSGHYVKATFKQILTGKNDITIYARPTDSNSPVTIEVYDDNTNQLVATFTNVDRADYYKVFLTDLRSPSDVFDLKIIGGSVDFDYIVDPTGWLAGWTHRKKITISKTNVGSDLSDFPALVKITADADMTTALSTGYDIRFTDSGGTTLLSYERESWTGGGGSAATAIFWVKVPTISSSANTNIYIYYGNAGDTDWTTTAGADADTANCASPLTPAKCVWKEGASQNFAAVYHLKETGTNPTVNDSTSNANNSTSQTWSPTTSGKVGSGGTLNGTSQYVRTGVTNFPATDGAQTQSIWAYYSSTPSTADLATSIGASNGTQMGFASGSATAWKYGGTAVISSASAPSSGAWHFYSFVTTGSNHILYIDGVSAGTGSVALQSGSPTNFYLGTWNGTDELFAGSLDEARVSSVARSADWVKFEYYNENSATNELAFATQENNTGNTKTWTGAVNGNWNNAGNWDSLPVADDNLVFPASAIASTTNNDFAAGTAFNSITISGSGYILAGNSVSITTGLTFDNNHASTTIVSLVLTGGGSVTKSGTGALTLSGTNTFTGGVTLNTGTLNINNAQALGTVAGTFTINGGTIDNTSGAVITTLNYPQVWNGDFTYAGTKGLHLGSGSVTPNASRIITTNNINSYLFVGGVIGGGAINLTIIGTGWLYLGGANTYTGTTTVLSGYVVANGNVTSGSPGPFGNATSDVLVGDTSGSASAVITMAGSFGRNVTVQAGSSGSAQIYSWSASPLTFSGNIALNKTVNLYNNAGGTTTFSGIISGGYGVNIYASNTGTVILSGANTYTGATSVERGTLSVASLNSVSGGGVSSNLGAPTTIANGTIALGSGTATGTLAYTGTGETTDRVINLSGTTGGGVIDQSGTGLLKFTSANTATGAGIKTLTLQGSTAGTGEISGVIVNSTSATAVAKSGTGTWTLSATNTFTGGVTLNTGTLNINNAQALGTVAGTFTINGGTIDNTTAGTITTLNYPMAWNGDFTFTNTKNLDLGYGAVTPNASRIITVNPGSGGGLSVHGAIGGGAINLTKAGNGILYLEGASTYTGTTSILAGYIKFLANAPSGSPGPFGNATSDIILGDTSGSAYAYIYAGNNNLGRNITVQAGSSGGVSLYSNGSGASAYSGNITLNKNINVHNSNGGSTTFSGIISGGYGIETTGNTGTIILSNANTYTGATTVSAGTLQIGAGGTTGSLSPSSAITNNATTTFNRSDTITQGTDFASVISGSGSLIKNGTGALTLNGVNTFTGGVTLNTGTLNINNAQALGTVAGTFTINGGTIDNTTAGTISLLNYPMAWNGDFTFDGTKALVFGSGAVTPNASRVLTINNSGQYLTVNGVIGGGAINLTKTGSGYLYLGGANTYTGTTTVLAGGLILNTNAPSGSAGALGNATSDVVLGDTSGSNSVYLQINGAYTVGRNITVQSGSSGGVSISGYGAVSSIYSGNITLNKNVSLFNQLAGGTTTFSGIISGGYNVNISSGNAGTVVLSGTNTFTGGTTLSAGTLTAGNTSALGTGAFTMSAGTTFNGGTNLTLGSNLTISGGTFNAPSGTLSIAGNFSNAGTFAPGTGTVTLTGTGASNTITSGGASFYNLVQNGTASTDTYTLQDPLVVSHNLTLTTGTLDTKSGGNFAVTIGSADPVNGNFSQATTAKFNARSSSITMNGNGTFTADGTVDETQFNSASLVLNGTNTLTYGHVASGWSNGFNNLTAGQNTYTTTLGGNSFGIKTVLTIGSGNLSGSGKTIYLMGANPLSVDSANSRISVGALSIIYAGNLTLPPLAHGYDSMIQIDSHNAVITQTGDIVINTSNLMIYGGASTVGINTWKTDGYNLTIGGGIIIGAGSDTGLKKLDATRNGARTSTITVGGNWLNYGNGTAPSQFIADNSTVILTGTSGSATITSGATNSPFYDLTQNGSGGTYTLQDPLVVSHNLTLTTGTLDTKNGGNYTVTIGSADPVNGNFSQTTTAKFNARVSLITVNGNGTFTADGTVDPTQFNSASLVLNGTNTLTYNHNSAYYNDGFNNFTGAQSGNTTTMASSFAVWNVATIGSGILNGAGKELWLRGSTPLSVDTANSRITLSYMRFYAPTQTIPALTNGYDCDISLERNPSAVTQTGNIILNTTHNLTLASNVTFPISWITDGYNLTVGGNLTIGVGSDSALKKLDATRNGARTSTITVGGNWLNYGNGTAPSQFIADNSTVIFNSTATGKTITSGATNSPFNNVTFNGTGGGWTLQDNLTASSTTLTQGTLVDNGKTVTVNGNISISNSAGSVLTSTGSWIQGASGNLSNANNVNNFCNLTIAGNGVTTTMTNTVWVGWNNSGCGALTMGPGTLTGNYQLYDYPHTNDAITVNNLTAGSQIQSLLIYPQVAGLTQKAITLPNNLFTTAIWIRTGGYNWTASGDWNFGNNTAYFESAGTLTTYANMGSSALTAGNVYLGYSGSIYNSYLKLGSSASHSIANIAKLATGTNVLDFGTGTTTVSGNIDLTGINATPGTSAVILNGSGAQTITSAGNLFNTITVTNASAGGVTFADRLQAATLNAITDGSTLKFAAAAAGARHTISSAMNITGGATKITLAPSVADTTWYLTAPTPTTATNVNVSYSNSSGHITPVNSTDGGHNVNWDFDTTAPTTSASATAGGISYTFGTWATSTVSVTLSCADNDGGVGCDTTNYPKYCVGAIDCTPTTKYTAPVSVSTEGVSYIRYYSADTVPNAETVKSSAIWIDTILPTLSPVTITSNNASTTLAKIGDTVTISFTSSEILNTATSTILGHTVTVASTTPTTFSAVYTLVSGDTEGTVPFKLGFTDVAGNYGTEVSAVTSGSNVIFDKTAPTISITGSNPATAYISRAYIDEGATATDEREGDISSSVATINPVNTSVVGTYYVYYDASDGAGNTATQMVRTVNVIPAGNGSPGSGATGGGGGGGGASPAPAPVSVSVPEGSFGISINGGAGKTDSRQVSIGFSAGGTSGVTAIILSDNPDFSGATTIAYTPSISFDLCGANSVCSDGLYTIYAKFVGAGGEATPAVSASITLDTVPVIAGAVNTAKETIKTVADKTSEIIGAILPPPKPKPIEFPSLQVSVPKIAQGALQHKWQIVPVAEMNKFISAGFPSDVKTIVNKFPEVGVALGKIGINSMDTALQLNTAQISLPGLAEAVSLPAVKGEANLSSQSVGLGSPEVSGAGQSPAGLATVSGLPISEMTSGQISRIPTDIVFARTADEKIDLNVGLSIGNDGLALQTLNTIQGQTLKLAVKPDSPAKNVVGYFIFKSNNTAKKPAKSALSQTASVINAVNSSLNGGVETVVNDSGISASTDLVLSKFEYEETSAGVWTADVASPLATGLYELKTVVNYKSPEKAPEELKMVVVVDPEGYIYEKLSDGREARLSKSTVSIYWLNPKTGSYELWPAKDFRQKNPQTTDVTGRYAFLVPVGTYYLTVTADSYKDYKGAPFLVEENKGVFINIEMKGKWNLFSALSLQNVLLGGIFIVLTYLAVVFTIRKKRQT